jgi:hypothetical protein
MLFGRREPVDRVEREHDARAVGGVPASIADLHGDRLRDRVARIEARAGEGRPQEAREMLARRWSTSGRSPGLTPSKRSPVQLSTFPIRSL